MLAKEQDYTGLIVGCVCVSLLLLLLGTLLMWRRNKHINGKRRRSPSGYRWKGARGGGALGFRGSFKPG